MARHRQQEVRWCVFKDYTTEIGDNYVDTYPILYGSQQDAANKMSQLQGGADPSWFDPETGFLYVDKVTL